MKMKDKTESIRRYDDALLKREPTVKVLRVLFVSGLGLFLAWAIIMDPSGFFQDRMAALTIPLVWLLVSCAALDASLRHIASIKLYRKEKEESQPQIAP
jgi:hypothetical protein